MKTLKIALFLLVTASALASTSVLTTTIVTDPDGQTWNNGSFSAQLTTVSGGAATIAGVPVTPTLVQGLMTATGQIVATLTNTSSIDQPGTKWCFTLTPNASFGPTVICTAVTGATPNLSTTLSAVPVIRFLTSNQAFGYLDKEFVGPVIGSRYYNVTQGCVHTLAVNGWNICNPNGGVITAAAGSTAVTNPSSGDSSNLIATDAQVQNAINFSQSRFPLAVTGGTYSFDSQGTGAQVVIFVSGGAISSIIATGNPGSGYAIGDLLFITPGGAVGGNGDAVIRVTAVSGTGFSTGQVIYGGTGYTATGLGSTTSAATGRPFTFILSGAITSNVQFIMKFGTFLTTSNQWIFANNTTGAFTVNVCEGNASDVCSGGSTVTLGQGSNNSRQVFLETDGTTNMFLAAIQNSLDLQFVEAAASNCNQSGTLTGVTGCLPLPVGGVTHYSPIF